MFGKKKENEASTPSMEDMFYLMFLIAEKLGVDFGDDEDIEEETTTEEKVEENAVVDTEKFFEEEKEEGDHNDSIKENEEVDKNHLEDEVIAIALKPDTEFKGGKEEKDATLRKLLTKGLYSPSTRSDKDNSCRKNELPDDATKKDQEKVQQKTGEDRIKDKVEDDEKRNSIFPGERAYRKAIEKGSYGLGDGIISRRERIQKANAKYSIK